MEEKRPPVDEGKRERFRGALLGVAVGDALGAPAEFLTRYEIHKRFGGELREMTGGGWLKLEPGQWTDDTAQTLLLAESYVARRAFDGLDFSIRLVNWLRDDPPNIGNQTRLALERVREAPTRWAEAAREVWLEGGAVMAGNGSLMRCSPTALFRLNNVDLLVRESIQQSQLTHYDPRCCEACVVANFTLSRLLHGEYSPDLAQQARMFLRAIRPAPSYKNWIFTFDPARISRAAAESSQCLPYPEEPDAVDTALGALDSLGPGDLRSTGYAVDTLQAALWIALRATSFEEGLIQAVNLGGDADTLGAVAGGLLGARFGVREIPARWGTRIAERARIISLADRLLELAPDAPEATIF